MALATYSFGSDTNKKKPMSHPDPWGKDGTDQSYQLVENVVLQVTNADKNNNKFYAIEIHKHDRNGFRLFTHYGRTDDLESKGEKAGTKECRYGDETEIRKEYQKILKEKQNPAKGYKQVHLAKSKIGSEKARGTSVGTVDQATLSAMNKTAAPTTTIKPTQQASKLHPTVRKIVDQFYFEAGQALTQKVNVQITADGFETPLGVLTLGQVKSGRDILSDLRYQIQQHNESKIRQFTSDFYTAIPHRIGRTKKDMEASIIDTIPKTDEIEETLQLMEDMLNIQQSGGAQLFTKDEVDHKYEALQTDIEFVDPNDQVFKRLVHYVRESQSKHHNVNLEVKSIFRMARKGEHASFNPRKLDNVRELFHGTRSANMIGILTRGLLLSNMASRHGAIVTGKMFGNGIYTASSSSKSSQYCGLFNGGNRSRDAFMFICGTALGREKHYEDAQPYLNEAPPGYDSVVGIPGRSLIHHEYIVYSPKQIELRYIVNFESRAR